MPSTDSDLTVAHDPRWSRALGALALVAVVAAAIWYVNTPSGLPQASEAIQASTPAGEPVYVGVFAPSEAFGRTLELSGIKVAATSNTEVDIEPLLCRRGNVGVTTDPERFCSELVDPEGEPFGAGDDIILAVTSSEPAIAVIERIRVGFRDGLRWGTEEAGSPTIVRVLPR